MSEQPGAGTGQDASAQNPAAGQPPASGAGPFAGQQPQQVWVLLPPPVPQGYGVPPPSLQGYVVPPAYGQPNPPGWGYPGWQNYQAQPPTSPEAGQATPGGQGSESPPGSGSPQQQPPPTPMYLDFSRVVRLDDGELAVRLQEVSPPASQQPAAPESGQPAPAEAGGSPPQPGQEASAQRQAPTQPPQPQPQPPPQQEQQPPPQAPEQQRVQQPAQRAPRANGRRPLPVRAAAWTARRLVRLPRSPKAMLIAGVSLAALAPAAPVAIPILAGVAATYFGSRTLASAAQRNQRRGRHGARTRQASRAFRRRRGQRSRNRRGIAHGRGRRGRGSWVTRRRVFQAIGLAGGAGAGVATLGTATLGTATLGTAALGAAALGGAAVGHAATTTMANAARGVANRMGLPWVAHLNAVRRERGTRPLTLGQRVAAYIGHTLGGPPGAGAALRRFGQPAPQAVPTPPSLGQQLRDLVAQRGELQQQIDGVMSEIRESAQNGTLLPDQGKGRGAPGTTREQRRARHQQHGDQGRRSGSGERPMEAQASARAGRTQ